MSTELRTEAYNLELWKQYRKAEWIEDEVLIYLLMERFGYEIMRDEDNEDYGNMVFYLDYADWKIREIMEDAEEAGNKLIRERYLVRDAVIAGGDI